MKRFKQTSTDLIIWSIVVLIRRIVEFVAVSKRFEVWAEVIEPNPANAEFHARKYQVCKLMYEHQLEYRGRRVIARSSEPNRGRLCLSFLRRATSARVFRA
jgi:hypothetical protein